MPIRSCWTVQWTTPGRISFTTPASVAPPSASIPAYGSGRKLVTGAVADVAGKLILRLLTDAAVPAVALRLYDREADFDVDTATAADLHTTGSRSD